MQAGRKGKAREQWIFDTLGDGDCDGVLAYFGNRIQILLCTCLNQGIKH